MTDTTTGVRWLSDQEQAVWRSYLRMQGEIGARLNRQLQTTSELSLADFEVLAVLSDSDDGRLRVLSLARMLKWEKSRLSHQLSRMERRGLVGRQTCPSDARGSFAVLTPAGRDAIAAAAPGHVAEVRRLLFDVLTPAQVKALGRTCDAVLDQLDESSCG
jgi:DNA-binding MarR family transcriptional regulator